jgi:carbon monoxide dehydrogenase subunit G
MKVSGEAVLHAPIDDVWQAINDPAVLVRTIPGCERLEATGPDAYRMVVSAGVAAIRGTYSGDVALHDQQPPTSFVMTASGAGGPGTVRTDVAVTLAEDGPGVTRLRYDADAEVGGMVAGVGQRMLAAVAKKTAGEFFAAVDDVLTGAAPAREDAGAASAVDGAGPAAGTGEPTSAGGRTFLAPARATHAASGGLLTGALVGAAIALAGVLVGRLLGQRG